MNKFLNQFDLDHGMPIHVSLLLDQTKDYIVESIIVGRHPVHFQEISKVILGHQTFFHCYLVFVTNKGKFFLEKNPRIDLKLNVPEMKEATHITNVPKYSMKEYMEKTSTYMGDKFIAYDCSTSNCQHFINGVLKGNGIPELDFIKQDVFTFLQENEFMNIGIKLFTRLKGYIDILVKGGMYTLLLYSILLIFYKFLKEIRIFYESITKGFLFDFSVTFSSSIKITPN